MVQPSVSQFKFACNFEEFVSCDRVQDFRPVVDKLEEFSLSAKSLSANAANILIHLQKQTAVYTLNPLYRPLVLPGD